MTSAASAPPRATEPRTPHGGNPDHPAVHGRGGLAGLALGALGVVFGDIGTSPLYAMQTVFAIDDGAVHPSPNDVYGVVSLVFWSIMLVVTIKYVTFVLRADNDGEGGVMALAALLRRVTGATGRLTTVALLLGVFGASLFYGDSLITPAISVLSAVEGVQVAAPSLHDAVLPIGVVVLAGLFAVQRFGTHRVGRAFGPIMIVWFVVIAVAGLREIAAGPAILRGLSPSYVVTFTAAHPYTTFVAMGAVVLVITGAEALYADMGHFGRAPIRRAWFALVLPALALNYLGQGALILRHPASIANPFYLLLPSWGRVPMVVLATAATVIASQAVISGAFSVSRQAVRLGFLPPLAVRQTSSRESGQIYVPAINWLLFAGVLLLMLGFRSSNRLATAYGVAVTGTLIITTVLLILVARLLWHWAMWRLVLMGVVFGGVEILYLAANLTKVEHGGWLPLLVAVLVFTLMTTWQRGRQIVTKRREAIEGGLEAFVAGTLHDGEHGVPITRVPGTAVFPHPTKDTAPLALRTNVEYNRVLHDRVIIVSVKTTNVPHVPAAARVEVDHLGDRYDGVVHLSVSYGFQDERDLPGMLREVAGSDTELDFDPAAATYFLSRLSLTRGTDHAMPVWQLRLFMFLARNAANPAMGFHLPEDRTVVMGAHLEL